MQRIKRFIAVFFVLALILFTPSLGVSELHINSDLWLDLSENEVSDLPFFGFLPFVLLLGLIYYAS